MLSEVTNSAPRAVRAHFKMGLYTWWEHMQRKASRITKAFPTPALGNCNNTLPQLGVLQEAPFLPGSKLHLHVGIQVEC
jgi:hypothetical protein